MLLEIGVTRFLVNDRPAVSQVEVNVVRDYVPPGLTGQTAADVRRHAGREIDDGHHPPVNAPPERVPQPGLEMAKIGFTMDEPRLEERHYGQKQGRDCE